jgi:hypothetical protein
MKILYGVFKDHFERNLHKNTVSEIFIDLFVLLFLLMVFFFGFVEQVFKDEEEQGDTTYLDAKISTPILLEVKKKLDALFISFIITW